MSGQWERDRAHALALYSIADVVTRERYANVFATGAAHGRRDVEAIRQAARAEAFREAARIVIDMRTEIIGCSYPISAVNTCTALLDQIEALAGTPSEPGTAVEQPQSDGASVVHNGPDPALGRVLDATGRRFTDEGPSPHPLVQPARRAAVGQGGEARRLLAALVEAIGDSDLMPSAHLLRAGSLVGVKYRYAKTMSDARAYLASAAPLERSAADERADVIAWLREHAVTLHIAKPANWREACIVLAGDIDRGFHTGASTRKNTRGDADGD